MKVLFIGGTGNISTACSRLALERGIDLFLLNRGSKFRPGLGKATTLAADINQPEQVKDVLAGQHFDVVVNFIAFKPEEVERDIALFSKICDQYIFISSASAYQKPPSHPVITESTPLANPFWDYSRDKIACEEILMKAYRKQGFPVDHCQAFPYLRDGDPCSHWQLGGFYPDRPDEERGKQVVIPGDGSSLWTLTHSDDFAIGFTGLAGQQAGHRAQLSHYFG